MALKLDLENLTLEERIWLHALKSKVQARLWKKQLREMKAVRTS